ncbi:hypothetical protein GS399_09895 [Pedobacter sp. HMF7647]|uniref:SMP-30/gluconolactonase/LRE family protein n=1 Tax=Hufsiella arboris TaxID=2695275 RepID=A0A7K1YA35_9SPHI|nr:SdiA-regulated domain-containing protein [Hufsiella arboris]MXV51280.1 hypothetical protein [Hufsiella arboris]
MRNIFLTAIPMTIILSAGVFSYSRNKSAPAKSYDLSKPLKTWKLPASLKEISGIAWVDANHLLAIEDLTPNLYLLNMNGKNIIERKVLIKQETKKFDLEDVSVNGTTAYCLRSDGKLYQVANWNTKASSIKYETGLSRDNNTEGICVDPPSKDLLIACKEDNGLKDAKKSTRAVYRFSPSTRQLNKKPFLLIEKKDLGIKEERPDVFPSAISIHPTTHDIYLLSTRENKCLMVYTYQGKFKSIQYLNADEFPQPEGICFAPDGTLFISTEGKGNGSAFLYEFKYQ